MKKQIKVKINNQSGAAMLIFVVFFLFISLAIISGLVTPTMRQFKIANDLFKSRQSFFLSESGIEDAYFRLKDPAITDPDSTEILTLNGNTATTSIGNIINNTITITTLGNASLRQRNNKLVLTAGAGLSFAYGVQSGLGGFNIANNASIDGNAYSNGPIVGGGTKSVITGTTVAASGYSISNMCISSNLACDAVFDPDETSETWAVSVTDTEAFGLLYCTSGSDNTDGFGDDKNCDTSKGTPPPEEFPISDQDIADWEQIAIDGGILSGNQTISEAVSLGPIKIEGDLRVNGTLNITGVIWVTGKISTAANATIRIDPSFGSDGGIIIADGIIDLKNNTIFSGSGDPDSYVLLISTSTCPDNPCSYGVNAIELAQNADAVLLNAQNGTVKLFNNVSITGVVGKKVVLNQGVAITYDKGLINTSFYTGPSGGWSIQSWKEIE